MISGPQTRSFHSSKHLRWVSLSAAVVGVVGGSLSLAGWITGFPGLTDFSYNGISIKFNTSLALTAVGLAMLLLVLSRKAAPLASVLAGMAAVIGALTLFEHITGVDLGIDNVIFPEPAGTPGTASPGRMGLPASLALTTLGTALLLVSSANKRHLSSVLATVTFCIAAFSLSGYFFAADQLYAFPLYTGIALRTAVMIAVLSIGAACLVPEYGFVEALSRPDRGGMMFRLTVLPGILIPYLIGWLIIYGFGGRYFDAAFGAALRSMIEIILLITLLWWVSKQISRSEAGEAKALKARAENDMYRRIAAAQESERKRISRDLHDHIGQEVTALRLRLESLAMAVPHDEKIKEHIAKTREQAARVDAELSMLVWQMRPDLLDSEGIASTLDNFVRDWAASSGIEVKFQTGLNGKRLPPDVETNIYRIAQEALNNIRKHASAKEAAVTLNWQHDEALLVVEDDGVGFEPEAESIHLTGAGGLGLVGIRERAALLGGTATIESSSDVGTAVMVRIPLQYER